MVDELKLPGDVSVALADEGTLFGVGLPSKLAGSTCRCLVLTRDYCPTCAMPYAILAHSAPLSPRGVHQCSAGRTMAVEQQRADKTIDDNNPWTHQQHPALRSMLGS